MNRPLLSAFLVCAALYSLQTQAQEPAQEPLEIGPSGEAYLQSLRFRRVETGVRYYDPTRPPPKLDTRERPRAERESSQSDGDGARVPTMLISGLALAIILIFAARIGGSVTLSAGGATDDPRGQRRRGHRGHRAQPVEPSELSAILAIRDRREAIMVLARSALAKAATANGLLLQRSWTARDALRRLSSGADHVPALRSLVLASELVHFGQRDISDEEFDHHVDSIRPLFAAGPV